MTPSSVGVPKPGGLRLAGDVVLGATVRVPLLLLLLMLLLLPTALFVCPMLLSLPPKDKSGRERTTVTSITSTLFMKASF
jgi:hypothetical protein